MENLYQKNIQTLRIQQMAQPPWHWVPNPRCIKTMAFFNFLGKDSLTPEEFLDIINMRFQIELEEIPESPIQTTFEVFSEHFIWKDTAGRRYAGLRQSEHAASKYYNIKAHSNNRHDLIDKLFDRKAVRKKREVIK